MIAHRSVSPAGTRIAVRRPLHRCRFAFLAAWLTAIVWLGTPGPSDAQKKGAPAAPAAAPTINMPLPMGMQRGTSLELTLTGANLAEPVAVLSSIPGLKATIPTDNNNGKDNAQLRVKLEVPKEAPMGYHTLRLVTSLGVSNLRLFCIDDLPQVAVAAGKTRETAVALPVPAVVAGKIDAESSNWFKIKVQPGQRLSFEVIGRRLGSPIDPQITVIDPRNLRELAHSSASPGLQSDPCTTHTFKEAGEYLIEIRDVMHRGGGDYVYWLRVGDFPCATTPIPMAARRGSKVRVGFAGSNVDGVAPVEVSVPTDPAINTIWVSPRSSSGLPGWPVALTISDLEEAVEQEPNDQLAKANPVPVPGAITARFEKKADVDHFQLPLKKGRWIIEAHSLEVFSPTEVYMVLKDAKGADVAKTDPKGLARLDFTAPADGTWTLAVEHLHYWGGPAESYRVTVTSYEPSFEVTLGTDRINVPQGSGAIVPIESVSSKDYKGPIELKLVGHPGLTGIKTIDSQAKAQPKQPLALMLVTAQTDMPMGAVPIRVQARAKIGGRDVVTWASTRPAITQALAGLPLPPPNLLDELSVAITEKPPFTLAAKFEHPEALRGTTVSVTITTTRAEGFDGEIALTPVGLPPNVAPVLKNIPKGANEIKGELKAAPNAPLGEFPISFQGKSKHQNKDFTVVAPPLPLIFDLPFDLKIEPTPVKIDVGDKTKFKVVAGRKGGYKGPITLEVRGLPTGVTASKSAIAADQNEVEIELTAAAAAVLGDKTDVNVLGTAAAAGNQQNASANFTLTVNKK